jgi:ABC-2 type transport system permease protein
VIAARAALRIAGHELRGYARAPAAWGIATLFLAVQGFGFAGQVSALSDPRRPAPLGAVLEGFFAGNLLTWSLGLVVIALIALRALAEERRAGTWEALLTAPVGEAEVVAGKWLAGAAYHAALWIPTALYLVVVAVFRPAGAGWDAGPVIGAYLGVALVGAALLAVAFAAAAAVAEPLIAGGLAFAAVMLVFLVGEVPALVPGLAADHPTAAAIVDALAVRARLADFARGEVTLAALALVVGLTGVGLSAAITAAGAGRRRWREVRARAAATALVAVIAVQLGAAAQRWPAAWDLTARRTNTLEPATEEVLGRIDQPIRITIVRPTLGALEPVFGEVERVARRIAAARAGVAVRVLDPATAAGGMPDIARQAGLAEVDLAGSGAVVVEVGDRSRVIDLLSLASFAVDAGVPGGAAPAPTVTRLSAEAELVAALRELADARPLVVCHTTGHGELGVEPDPAVAELAGVAARIRRDGGRLVAVASVAQGVPAECSVVVVGGPVAPLPGADALAIDRWLAAGGGGLLVLAAVRPDGGELPPTGLEPVIASYGIELIDAVAVDAKLALDTPGTLRVVDGYGAGGDPITAGFAGRRATVWLVPRALALEPPARAIVSTTAAGWGERRWREPPAVRDPDDLPGPVAIAAAAEKPGVAGRVVVIGSAESLSSAVAAGATAGDLLAIRAIRWLAHRDQPAVELRDKTPEQVRLVMTAGERRAVIALCAVGVPLAFGGLGALAAWRRRRRTARAEAAS